METKRRGGGLGVALTFTLVLLLLLPPSYFLSLGPMALFYDYVPASAWKIYIKPADFLMERCPPFQVAVYWYNVL